MNDAMKNFGEVFEKKLGEDSSNRILSRTIQEQDLESIFESLEKIYNSAFSVHRINNIIKLCVLPVYIDEKKTDIALEINPIQDFLASDIVENSKKAHGLDRCNITFLEKDSENNTYSVHHEKRKKILAAIQEVPKLEEKIMKAYYYVYSSLVPGLHHKDKSFLSIRKKTFEELWIALIIPSQKDFLHNRPSNTSTIESDGLLAVKDSHGSALVTKVKMFLETQAANKKELLSSLFRPIRRGKNQLQLDGKFLYLDNGHYLYQDILYNSSYNDYFQKEIELIVNYGPVLESSLYGKYTGLGVGNGEKDFELLRYAQPYMTKIFIDSSLPSLQEAELLCRGNTHKINYGQTHASAVMFSQDWISKLLESGTLKIRGGTFGNPHPMVFNINDFHEEHNFFSMLGGTYGNFSGEYKIQFLRQLDAIMQTGDQLLLSVFKKPTSSTEIQDIINHYDTEETFSFISNFFEKLGINTKDITLKVGYVKDTISIDAILHPAKAGEPEVVLSGYGEKAIIKKPIHIEILRSQRIDDDTMKDYIKQSKTSFKIQQIIQENGNPFVFYILSK